MGQMGQYQQLQDRVIDLTVEINGSSMTYVVPESRDVAMSNNITLACSVDPIMNQLNAAKRTSSDILDSIDKHRRTLEACDSILEEINPAFKQTKDQDRKIKNLEEKVDRMGSSFDELKELLIKKLG
jgi:tetrahydromethanopterin S-methyltransferase subunit B